MPSLHRKPFPGFLLSLLMLMAAVFRICAAEVPTLVVQDIEGKARVQRSGEHSWSSVSAGLKLSDNDIVETEFNARLTLALSDGGSALIGSGSRVLISIPQKAAPAAVVVEPGFFLLSGGILLKPAGQTPGRGRIALYTGSAVAEVDSGVFAAFIETEERQTGFFNLGGRAVIRGLMQQKSRILSTGRASFILPGRDPMFHIPISLRHAAALKRLFGDTLIDNQLRSASIVPLDEKQAENGIALSLQESADSLEAGRQEYEPHFSLNKIYGSILDERATVDRPYTPILRPERQSDSMVSIGILGDIGSYGSAARSYASIAPCWRTTSAEAALRIAVGQNANSQTVTGVNTSRGILDKIDHLRVGVIADSTFFTLGALTDVTLGDGLIVSHFRNADDNRIFHSVGAEGRYKYSNLFSADLFLADVTDPSLGGIHVATSPSMYTFGAGYYWDTDPYRHTTDTSDNSDVRYAKITLPPHIFPDTSKITGGVGVYELELGVIVSKWSGFEASVHASFAQDRQNGADNGEIYKMPEIEFTWPRQRLNFGYFLEKGQILSSEFDEFYYSHRSFFRNDTLLTENTALSLNRFARNVFATYQTNVAKGIDMSAGYTQIFGPDNAFNSWSTIASTETGNSTHTGDFSLDLRLSLNDSAVSFLKYAAVYLRQHHGELFPPSGGLLSSWNADEGFEFTTRPLLYRISLQGSGRFFHLDNGPLPDNRIGPGEGVAEFSLGAVWSIL
jgi:hypothetical protein